MMYLLTNPVRALLLAAALCLSAPAVGAGHAPQAVATARTAARNEGESAVPREDTSTGGVMIIVVIVGVVIVLAWVCSRVGDSRPTMS